MTDTNTRHVYICSAGHSGSTLLDMMLGANEACESLGELSLLPMDIAMGNRCGCGANYQDCAMWSPVLQGFMADHGVDLWTNPYALNLGYMAGMEVDRKKLNAWYKARWYPMIALKYAQLRWRLPLVTPFVGKYDVGTRTTLEFYDRVLRHTGKPISVDSTKRYFKAAALYTERPAVTRLVLLIRDGRGVFYSGLKRGFSREYSVKAWFDYYNRALPLFSARVAPEHMHVVRYEELVQDPQGVLEGLCGFLGIAFSPEMLAFKSVAHHNVNGNDMKFSSSSKLKLDEAWRTKMSSDALAYFERRAGPLNRRLGYR